MADSKYILELELKGNARQDIKKLKEELYKLPEGTEKWNDVQRKLGEITDKVGDLNRGVTTLSGDPLERLNNSFGMIGSSITSLDFGAAQQGLQGMSGAIKDFKIKDATAALKGFGSTAFELGKSLLLNPLFAIPALVVLIITKMDSLISMGGKIGAFFQAIKDKIDAVWNAAVAFLDATGLIDSKAEERAKDEKKRAEESKKLEAEKLKKQKEVDAEKEKLAKEAAEKERARLQKVRDDQNQLTNFLKTEQEKRFQDTLSEQDRELRQLQLAYDEKKKLAHGNKDLLKKLENEYQAEVSVINSKFEKKRNEDALAAAKKQKDLLKQIENDTLDEREALAQEIQNIRQGEQATEIQNLRDSYFEKIELAKKYGLDSTALEEQLAKEEAAINEKYKKEEVKLEKYTAQQKFDIAFAVAGNLMSIMDSLGKQDKASAKRRFNINKALGVAQAGINTYMAVNAALTAGGNPIKLATGAQFVEAGVALTMGLASVAKIAATKFNDGGGSTPPPSGGGGGGLGGMGGGSTSAPSLDLSFLNNAQTKAQPIQSYVLATNVTSAQDAQQKIIDQSKLIK